MRGSRNDELWLIEYSDKFKKAFALKNKSSGRYLDVSYDGDKYKISFKPFPCYWYACLAKHAPSPGQVAILAGVTPVAAVAAAFTGGAAGAGIAAALGGWGTSVMIATGAATASLASISAAITKVAMDPANDDWVVNKM